MATTFTLPDRRAASDLAVMLGRAARLDEASSVRLIADSRVLAVYVAVIHPRGLLDRSPTVLGLRTTALTEGEFDVVVPVRSLVTRVETAVAASPDDESTPVTIAVPTTVNTVIWTAITPPRGGWQRMASLDASALQSAATAGIDEVATAVPSGLGSDLVHRVRSEVWGRAIPGIDHLPAGVGFAALSLGFLGDDPVTQFASGPWIRLSTVRGHVLVKQSSWSLGS